MTIIGGSFLILAGVLVGLYFGFRALLGLAAPRLAASAGASVGLYLVALLLLAFLLAWSRGLRKSIAERLASGADIEVSARAADAGSGSPTVELQLSYRERRLRLLPFRLDWRAPAVVQEQIVLPAPANVPYATAVDLLSKPKIHSGPAGRAGRPQGIRSA